MHTRITSNTNMATPIRVALADNQEIYRKGMVSILNTDANIKVVAETSNGKDLLEQIKTKIPDVIILDNNMPVMCGAETTKILRKLYPNIGILIQSTNNNKALILNLIENGANGFLHKDTNTVDVLESIYAVKNNGYYLSELASKIMFNTPKRAANQNLSKREIEVVRLLSKEFKNSEIAEKLFINIRTVERHRENIRVKINARNLSGILMYAIKHNLLE